MTFSVTNADAVEVTDFIGWVFGLQVIPNAGTTGTLAVGTLAAASSNQMPVGNVDIAQPPATPPTLGTAINGTTDYYPMDIQTTTAFGTLSSGASYSLGALSFDASGDASGTWTIYAVQEAGNNNERTYWYANGIVVSPFANWTAWEFATGYRDRDRRPRALHCRHARGGLRGSRCRGAEPSEPEGE